MTGQQIAAMRPLEDRKAAVIVGASTGIGAALARRLAKEGYTLGLLARRGDLLDALCAELNADGVTRALAYVHDVTETDVAAGLLAQVTHDLGGLDLFVYNAGVMYRNDRNVYDVAQDLATIEVNVLGAVAWLLPVAERFARAKRGHIVGIGSIAGVRGRAGMPAYTASKAALHAYLEGLRNRLAAHRVTVTTIRPGQVDTDMLKNADKVRGPISAEQAAELIWRAIKGKKEEVYIPARWGLIALVVRHMPSVIFKRLNI